MVTIKILKIKLKGIERSILFGYPSNKDEINDIYTFRYKEYLDRGYINKSDFKEEKDIDEYDDGRSFYFFAKWENKIIATIRLIRDDILPTEKSFRFNAPDFIKNIDPKNRFELGRFIIVPLDKINKLFLPRQIAMITMFRVIFEYANQNNLLGGYSFVKTSLLKKLLKIKAPIVPIINYKQTYGKDGVLYKYFNQEYDKVVPIAFLVESFKSYINKIFSNKLIFSIKDDNIIIKDNLITKILLFLRLF